MGRKRLWVRKALRLAADMYYSALSCLSDEAFARFLYRKYTHERLDLNNPKSFNEKLWWLKLYYRNPLMRQCSDKFTVREYVESCGLGEILVRLYGVYDTFDEVPFAQFRDPVFIKCTKGSGGNVIYAPGEPFDYKGQRALFRSRLKTDYTRYSREWNYGGTPNRILCEEVLRARDGSLPLDYKIMCFNGKPRLLFFSRDVCSPDGQHNVSGTRFVNVYDVETLELLPIETSIPSDRTYVFSAPENFSRMMQVAAVLASPFPFCRVDLYNVDGKIYFGEITFFPSGGCDDIQPREWALTLGDWIDLSGIQKGV